MDADVGITPTCTRVAKSGVLTMENRSSRPGDFGRYLHHQFMPQDSVDDLYKLGVDCLESGDYSGGLDAFVRADKLCPNDHEILHFMGVSLAGLGRHEDAAERIGAAVKLFPQFPDALADLGDCFAKLGRCGDAKLMFEEALEFLLPGEELRTRVESSSGKLP